MEQNVFTELVVAAIGDRTKKEFAKLLGISPEYLSRLMNINNRSIPSKEVLRKIAEAAMSPDVTYGKLLQACGYRIDEAPFEIGTRMLKQMRIFAMQLKEGKCVTFKTVDTSLDGLRKSIPQAFDSYVHTLAVFQDVEVVVNSTGRCYECNCESNEAVKYENYIGIQLRKTFDISSEFRFTTVDLFCVLMGHFSQAGAFYLEDILFDMKSVMEYGAESDEAKFVVEEDGVDYDRTDLDRFIFVTEDTDAKERYNQEAKKFLEKIFGTNGVRKVTLVSGYGMYLEEMPKRFVEFAANHYESWADTTDPVLRARVEAVRNHEAQLSQEDLYALFEESCTQTNEDGWQSVISNTISAETPFNAEFWQPDENDIYDFKNRPMVIINNEMFLNREDDNELLKQSKEIMIGYARELGVEQIENCYYELELVVTDKDRDVTPVNVAE